MKKQARVAKTPAQRRTVKAKPAPDAPEVSEGCTQCGGTPTPLPDDLKPPRGAAQCRTYMRKVLVREFPAIVQGFVNGAKEGSCQHVKLATELLDARKPATPVKRGQGTLKRLIRKMEQLDD